MNLPKYNPSPKRVLIRPPSQHPPPADPPLPPPPASPAVPSGVVVVGFIGRRNPEVGQLINRIIDSNVFGSGNADRAFSFEKGEGSEEVVKEWFKWRKISYYVEEEKGVLYLQFSSTRCPGKGGFSDEQVGFDIEEHEFGDLQGMLFMFSVCHVIIFIHEGSHFDIQILKKFRVLQAAKHAMAPFVKSKTTPPLPSRSHTSFYSRASSSGASSNRSPSKAGGFLSRNGSSVSLMSGLGSYTSLFPGQCTPVTLFVFLDDFSEVNCGSSGEESADTSVNHSSSSNSSVRSSLPMKGSGSVVVLSRPVNKSEGGIRKKLQSSLEAQIRFSIKKCRTLTGSESGHVGPRSGGISSSAPLFSLDASRAVALVDRSSNQKGHSLEFATDLVENILNGTRSSDYLLLESHNQSSNKEDIESVKEFIYRQFDILRGRGGVVANSSSGSAAGMVAVAAAAAAASAASGMTVAHPDLPSLETWLSSSQLILHGILSAKRGSMDEPEVNKRKARQRNAFTQPVEVNSSNNTDPLESAVSCLDSSRGLNSKFSTSWCQRALPVAKDIYLNELPACYPTSVHEAHLEKALSAFSSMVKGPAVKLFLKKLEEECTSIWCSGRQLCDAVSLTGKPCMHQRHDVDTSYLASKDEIKSHSSGFVFLHACACGRTRRLRSDPFEFETANITSSCYPECDKLLSALQLPQGSYSGPIQPSSWSLIRVGGARYYEPAKGLLQSGFCATQKFLLKWKILLEKRKQPIDSPSSVQQITRHRSSSNSNTESAADGERNIIGSAQVLGEMPNEGEIHGNSASENIKSDNKKTSFGKAVPNFTMRKPFAEVVAGSAADLAFPPLQSKKQTSVAFENSKKSSTVGRRGEQVHESNDYQGSKKSEDASVSAEIVNGNGNRNGNSFLHVGSNVIPVSANNIEKHELNSSLKHAIVYVGFEHECPHGHRFILTPEHLNELGTPYSVNEESNLHYSSTEVLSNKVVDPSKLVKTGGHGKVHRHGNGIIAIPSKDQNTGKTKERMTNGNHYVDAQMQFSVSSKGHNNVSTLSDSMKDVEASLQSISLEDGGLAFSLLNRSVPVYMSCPHCRTYKNKKDPPNVKFAGTISQLQRIFLVTPTFPLVLAACPVIQFEASCLPPSVADREQKLQFSLGCRVILPPESFLSLRLPFVYGVQLEDGSVNPLKPFEDKPELTAWITKSTTLQILSKGGNLDEKVIK